MAAISQDFRVACGMKHLAPTFVARLDSAEPRQARAALEALTTAWRSLRGDPQFAAVQGVLAEAGAVGSLVRLLRDGPAALRCQTMVVLGFLLERNATTQAVALEAGAMPLLVDALLTCAGRDAFGSSSEEAKPSVGATRQLPASMLTAGAVFCLGLAISGNRTAARAAISSGVMSPLTALLSGSDLSRPVRRVLLAFLMLLLDVLGEVPASEGASDLWPALGLDGEHTTASRLAELAGALHGAAAGSAAALLEAGALLAVEGILLASADRPDAAETAASCAGILLAFSREAEGAAFVRSSIGEDSMQALCLAAVDAADDADDAGSDKGAGSGAEGSAAPSGGAVEALLSAMVSSGDTAFLARLLQAPGCLGALLAAGPALSAATLSAASSSWALQLALCSRAPPAPLALLAPHARPAGRALLAPGRMEALLGDLLQGLATPGGPPRSCGEAAQALTTLSSWLTAPAAALPGDQLRRAGQPCSTSGANAGPESAACRLRPRRRDAAPRRKRARPGALRFVVAGQAMAADAGDLVGLSPLLDGLLETAEGNTRDGGDAAELALPCPAGLPEERLAPSMAALLAWAAHEPPAVDPAGALALWRLADFLDVPELAAACEPAVAAGLAAAPFWLEVVCAGGDHPSAGLLAMAAAHLARNLQGGLASGNLARLARGGGHVAALHGALAGELRAMLTARLAADAC
eukprot:jgi/Tetstr1/420707/TSEL_011791.t1